jgi:hypothetical protein
MQRRLIPEKPVRNFLAGQDVFIDRGYPGDRMPPLDDHIVLSLLNFPHHLGKIIYHTTIINLHQRILRKKKKLPTIWKSIKNNRAKKHFCQGTFIKEQGCTVPKDAPAPKDATRRLV